jgi:signal transduction histidine kinase
MTESPRSSLRFADVRKLELDELIDQLVERAEGVKRAQGRLRALLRAIDTIGSELSLDAVLRNVISAACELAHARYGALGVIGDDGSLEQFIHVGMDADVVARIGELPKGRGLLGALITDPHPIRLRRIADDERSAGFPRDHPSMESFLGVPIRVHGEVFGNLYLTDSAKGEFSSEDEELVVALALAAGTAISNARLYQESQLQHRWLGASVEIGAQLLAAVGEDPLHLVARRAIEIGDADLVTVSLLNDDRTEIVVEAAFGFGADELIARRFAVADTIAGTVVNERRPLLVPSATAGPLSSPIASVIEAGPVMVLPLMGTQQVHGVMSLVRHSGRPAFTTSDLDMAAGFANHASVALELAGARAAEQRVVLLEDRERIARDLHDHVIQELFAIGLSLESTAMQLGADTPAGQRITQRVADLDRTIRQIRTSIFELRGPLAAPADGIRQRILSIASDLTPALGFPPNVAFAGLVDIGLDADLSHDLIACAREGLTNAAKYARASRVTVDLVVSSAELALTVSDNGVGIAEAGRLSGLANLRQRAERRGGSFDVTSAPGRGTTLLWKAPLT